MDRSIPEIASLAEQLLLDRTCDSCRWRTRTDRVQGGRFVFVAEKCLQRRQAVPEVKTCMEWIGCGGRLGALSESADRFERPLCSCAS